MHGIAAATVSLWGNSVILQHSCTDKEAELQANSGRSLNVMCQHSSPIQATSKRIVSDAQNARDVSPLLTTSFSCLRISSKAFCEIGQNDRFALAAVAIRFGSSSPN